MSAVMTPEEFHPWSNHLQLTAETEALITTLGSSPPVRRVRGRTNNVTGHSPSPKWAAVSGLKVDRSNGGPDD